VTFPERDVITDWEPCDLAEKWGIDPRVMEKLLLSAQDFEAETRSTVRIISGYRTKAQQLILKGSGRPTAPDAVSTHRSCPATGVDVNIGNLPVVTQKHIWGRILFMNGLRWGGGSKLDEDLIPLDWQHVDAGPRT